jgi:hypothetical protein
VRELRKEFMHLQDRITDGPAPRYLTIPEVAEMFGVRRDCSAAGQSRGVAGTGYRQAERFGPDEIDTIHQSLVKRGPELPPNSRERRRWNKRIRAMFQGGG